MSARHDEPRPLDLLIKLTSICQPSRALLPEGKVSAYATGVASLIGSVVEDLPDLLVGLKFHLCHIITASKLIHILFCFEGRILESCTLRWFPL
jgi:hypothetical protein